MVSQYTVQVVKMCIYVYAICVLKILLMCTPLDYHEPLLWF